MIKAASQGHCRLEGCHSRKRGPLSHTASQEESTDESDRPEKRTVSITSLCEARLDNIGHLPVHKTGKGHCRHCMNGIIRTACAKCGLSVTPQSETVI